MGFGTELPTPCRARICRVRSEAHANNVGTFGAGESGTSQGEPRHQISASGRNQRRAAGRQK